MPIYIGNNSIIPSGMEKVYVGNSLVYNASDEEEYFYVEVLEDVSCYLNVARLGEPGD